MKIYTSCARKLKISTNMFVLALLLLASSCSQALYEQRIESAEKLSQAADTLLLVSSELRREINKKVEENPNSSSEDFLELMDKKTREIETVQSQIEQLAPQRSFEVNQKRNFNKIRAYQQKLGTLGQEVNAIYKSFERELDKKLESDIYFSTGSSVISKDGIIDLKDFVYTDIQNVIKEWEKEAAYKNKPKKVKIKVIGYADMQGLPNQETRKRVNKKISEERASAVKDQLNEYLEQLKNKYMLQVTIEHEGKGEEAPPGIEDIIKVDNPERRICIISSYVIPVF